MSNLLCKNCNEKLKSGAKFCGHCGTSTGVVKAKASDTKVKATAPVTAETSETLQPYLVNPTKLVVLSTLTFGIYDIYWFMKQWRQVKIHESSTIWPFWRAVFGILFVWPLFKKLGATQPGSRAIGYIMLSLLGNIQKGNWWLISLFSVLAPYLVQKELNARHNATDLGSYSTKEKIVATLGGLFWLLVIWSLTRS